MTIVPQELVFQLYDKFCSFDNQLQADLRESGWPDVSRTQSLVMINLVRGERRPAEIARNMRVSRQSMHITLKQMAEIGIICFTPDPANKRYRIIEFTDMGMKMNERAGVTVQRFCDGMAAALGPKRAEDFMKSLSAVWSV